MLRRNVTGCWKPGSKGVTGQLMHFPGASAQEKDPAGYSWCAVVNLFGGNGGPACDLFLETTGR